MTKIPQHATFRVNGAAVAAENSVNAVIISLSVFIKKKHSSEHLLNFCKK